MTQGKSSSAGSRHRNFATVVYPESAPDNWIDILSGLLVPCFVSPLHDKDSNPNGEPKKPHFHVLFMFEGKKSVEQIKTLIEPFNGVGCEVVQSLRGYARYLCHLDNPEKFQYDISDVRSMCGADYNSIIGLAIDKYKAVREMMQFCSEYDIDCYSDLLEYAAVERSDWFRILCDTGTFVMKEYLKSKSWKAQER